MLFYHAPGSDTGVQADFCAEEFAITIDEGDEGMIICRNITINNDMICEGPEDFNVVLASGPDGGSIITNSPGTVTILDDDGKHLSYVAYRGEKSHAHLCLRLTKLTYVKKIIFFLLY